MAGAEGSEGEQPSRKRRRRPRRRKPKPTAAGAVGTPATAAPAAAGRSGRARSKAASAKRRANPPKPKGKKTPDRARRIPTQKEVSAGGVLYRSDGGGGIEVVLASRRTRRGDLAWGLAKGGIEPGETREEAAIREVREETGLEAEIEADLGDTKYIYVWEDVRIRKTVHFFLMRHTGGDVEDRDDEMEEIRWFPLERARKRAAYRGERDVLARAAELLG
ncbi:MAG TPA: NUDIX hydrolase [Actinomycetota bacterium]|nr:NUDIX hydrolase [Actinomycetota bacterium]